MRSVAFAPNFRIEEFHISTGLTSEVQRCTRVILFDVLARSVSSEVYRAD